jgi:hypothetical protein
MDKQHPHFGASYKIAQQPDGGFGVEVTIPDTQPVNVTGFGTRKRAGAWVANHRREVAAGVHRTRPSWNKSRG